VARILLVDDDIAEISAVKRVLVRAGHQAVLATNASDALAVVAQATPALALIAAACEGGEALALAHRLAAGDGAPPVPLILLGHAEGVPDGAAQLARPVDPSQLAQEVTAALARAIAAAPAPSRAVVQAPVVARGNGTAAVAVRRTVAPTAAGRDCDRGRSSRA
jgi:DNA-binding response OmpR family regulator